MHQQDKSLSPDNLQRFRSYVERHQKLGGPDRAIVETWRGLYWDVESCDQLIFRSIDLLQQVESFNRLTRSPVSIQDYAGLIPATRLIAFAKFCQIDRCRTSVPRPPGVRR